jgi:hypothetical protein
MDRTHGDMRNAYRVLIESQKKSFGKTYLQTGALKCILKKWGVRLWAG